MRRFVASDSEEAEAEDAEASEGGWHMARHMQAWVKRPLLLVLHSSFLGVTRSLLLLVHSSLRFELGFELFMSEGSRWCRCERKGVATMNPLLRGIGDPRC